VTGAVRMSSYVPFKRLDEGIRKSVDNATRYLDDAVFLHRNEKFQSSVLLPMLAFEEAGKALLLADYEREEKKVTKTQWRKRFCSHGTKNLSSIRRIWQDVGYTSPLQDSDIWQAKFQVDWKNVFTYVDYDFENGKWTSPESSVRNTEDFSYNSMRRAAEALECVSKRVNQQP
jgi:AbiV family abortive infection protein